MTSASRAATSRPTTQCMVCHGNDLTSVLFLGHVPPANALRPIGHPSTELTAYPLELLRCARCTLVQLGTTVDPEVVFPPDFPYRTGGTKALRDNFAQLAAETAELLDIPADGLVLDIGSNDGTLLDNFQRQGHRVLGVEPSSAAKEAEERGIPSRMAFFTRDYASQLVTEIGHADLITSTNTFAHVPDVGDVVEGIVDLLTPDGVFVSESHYLVSLVETLQYDTVYHEHLRFYTLASLSWLLDAHGLEVFDVKRIPTHGGSIRVYAGKRGRHPVQPAVTEMLTAERNAGFSDGTVLEAFRDLVVQSKLDLLALLAPLKREGRRVYAVGAAARASTLINYVGLDENTIDCVLEISSSAKLGKYMAGTRIPILDEDKLVADQPDYALLLSWHIADDLVKVLRGKGFTGRFLVPLPAAAVTDA
jgi:SAM-dependent methyltransferase